MVDEWWRTYCAELKLPYQDSTKHTWPLSSTWLACLSLLSISRHQLSLCPFHYACYTPPCDKMPRHQNHQVWYWLILDCREFRHGHCLCAYVCLRLALPSSSNKTTTKNAIYINRTKGTRTPVAWSCSSLKKQHWTNIQTIRREPSPGPSVDLCSWPGPPHCSSPPNGLYYDQGLTR